MNLIVCGNIFIGTFQEIATAYLDIVSDELHEVGHRDGAEGTAVVGCYHEVGVGEGGDYAFV